MTTNKEYTMTQSWEAQAQFKEYLSAVNPKMPKIDVDAFLSDMWASGETRVIPFDLSSNLETEYPATTPNLYAGYLRVNANDSIKTDFVAASQMFFVIRGRGNTQVDQGNILWKTGDLFTLPATQSAEHFASEDAVLFWVNDAPLLSYLGVAPTSARFTPVLYTRERLTQAIANERADTNATKRNRLGVLLSNPHFPKTMTLTHTLWSLYNVLPAGITQKPHRHNSIAIDHCVSAGPDTYTLIGKELDEHGNIVNPIKAMWTAGSTFITPPGWWHSHHNDSDVDAVVLPIQDAGLIMNMQVLDFKLVK